MIWADINILYFHRDLTYTDECTCQNSVIVLLISVSLHACTVYIKRKITVNKY